MKKLPRRSIFKRKAVNFAVDMFSLAVLVIAIGLMLYILLTVFHYGLKAINWSFLVEPSKPYGVPDSGIANAILGTVFITVGAAALSIVPAVLAGIYLAEFDRHSKFGHFVRFCANVNMGVPSVVIGLFVYSLVVMTTGRFSGFAGSISLAILMFPVIMRTTEDMLLMVPDSLRESALAIGNTRMRATIDIVCKAARSGMLTGILLAIARVSGETAPLLFTAQWSDSWPTGYFSNPTANLPVLITEYATNSPFPEQHTAGWGAALIVTLLVLSINILSRIIFREKHHAR